LSPWPQSAYEAEVSREDSIILLASTSIGVTVGFILGRILPGDGGSPTHAEIYNVGVLEDFRKLGVGTSLLANFLEISRAFGVSQVFLEVRQSNAPAIGFYSAHGFEKTGERKNFYSDPVENADTMTLAVSYPEGS
jgi:ribosomal-protein-alanine N-acetyltransferase